MSIKGLIFDFDGLILDTETPDLSAWLRIYEKYGQSFDFINYSKAIGAIYEFSQPAEILATLVPGLSKQQVLNEWFALERQMIDEQNLSQGIEELLKEAKASELKISIASSSINDWVFGHLDYFGIRQYFNSICTVDLTGIPKPDPALYNLALKSLNLQSFEAIAFEDSPNGITAAKAAGIYCVAIPNPTTRMLNLSEADLVIDSLEDFSLSELIKNL